MPADLASLLAEAERLPRHKHANCTVCLDAHEALALLPRLAAAVRAALVLRAKMKATYDDPRYMNVWAIAQAHIGPYTGPDWIAEAAAFDDAAAGGEQEECRK